MARAPETGIGNHHAKMIGDGTGLTARLQNGGGVGDLMRATASAVKRGEESEAAGLSTAR